MSKGIKTGVGRTKKKSVFEVDAQKRSLLPSPSHYKLKPVNEWLGLGSLNRSPSNMGKADRITEIDRLFLNSKVPEKSTLGPQNYKFSNSVLQVRPAMHGYATLMQ